MNGDKRFAPGDEKSIPRSSVSEVYASIEADLIYASQNLSVAAAENGRTWAALALGKAYLYQEKFNEAASTFEILINGNYRLVQTADLTAEQINGGLTHLEVF
jgi:roadblock/LC7 domain-containing protein